jgi:hypothetical protein
MNRALRFPSTIGTVTSFVEIADPEFVLRICGIPKCTICSTITFWLEKRALEKAQAEAAAAESGFVVVG